MKLLTSSCVFFAVVTLCVCVNETSVEENEIENEIEKEQTFEELESSLKKRVNDMIRKLLPRLMEGGSGATISGPCMSSIMRIIGGVRQLKEWALRFIDATGKLPAGVLEGTSLSLGDFDECLDIKVGKKNNPPTDPADVIFGGKYCLLEAHRPKALQKAIDDYEPGNRNSSPIARTKTVLNLFVRYKHLANNNTFKLGVCIPSKCSQTDLQNILKSDSLKDTGSVEVAYCETGEEKSKTTEQYIILGFFAFMCGCLLLGTCMDVYLRIKYNPNAKIKKIPPEKPSVPTELVRSLSLYSNALDLVDVSVVKEPLRVLCALRSIAVILTVYSHTYGHIHDLHFQKFSKAANFMKFFDSFTFTGIANGSVGMDTIIFIAGITITYSRWRNVSKMTPVKLNIMGLLTQRFFRLSAAQLLITALFLLLPIVGSGPLWSAYTDYLFDNCRQKWWLNILYIGNFWSAKDTCLYHTWIVAVIMQLTLLSTVILWILKWSPKGGIGFSVLLILAGVIGVAVMTVVHDLPGGMAFFMLDKRTATFTWRRVYTLAYDHVGPFCIGLLTGYFLGVKNHTLNISKRVCALIWCISICSVSAVLFGLYHYRKGGQMGIPLAAFYAATHRNVWALGIAWIVIACTTGHGGVAKRFLYARIFVFFDRLCYMAFLLHIPIIYYHSGVIRERWYMGHFELMFFGMGYVGLSFIFSAMLYVTCNKPYYFLEAQIKSCFVSKDKLSFRSQHQSSVLNYLSKKPPLEDFAEINGCVDGGYSQKMDGV